MAETLDPAARADADAGAAPPAAETLAQGKDLKVVTGRAEIDTSAPFESVKEAVDRFGGSALWKSQLKRLFSPPEKHHPFEEVDLMAVGDQTSKLEMELIVKEREALDVLKELEITKRTIGELKLKLQKETSEVIITPEEDSDILKVNLILNTGETPRNHDNNVEAVASGVVAKQPPGLILMKLKQAKVNLNRTTSNLAGIQASVDLLNSMINEEKRLLEKTSGRLSSNTLQVPFLEEEIHITSLELLQRTKDAKSISCDNTSDISSHIKQLNYEKEQYKKKTEAAKSEVCKLIAEIEQTKASIKAAEIRCLAAKKMEEAAKAAEAIALSKIKVLTDSNIPAHENTSTITLPIEEYAILTCKAQEADEMMRKKIETAILQIEDANRSKQDLLMKVEEVTAEAETSRTALEEALKREESANRAKLEVEAALRRWRSEHSQKRRYAHNSTKFKNSHPGYRRRDSRMLDVNGLSLTPSGLRSPLLPTLSIGQILSRKLMGPEEYSRPVGKETKGKSNVSLGEILSRRHGQKSPQGTDESTASKQCPIKRKKHGFASFSINFASQNKKSKKKKKKRHAWTPQVNCGSKLV